MESKYNSYNTGKTVGRVNVLLKGIVTLLLVAFLGLRPMVGPAVVAADEPPPPAQHQVTVMTRNVYHGVDYEIFRVPGATSLGDLMSRVRDVYEGYHARNFPERAQALAAEIEATHPDLIGLQEAILVRTGPLFDPGLGETVVFDYVQLLLDALSARGLNYRVVVEQVGLDVDFPSTLGFDVRHTDREVILARSDLPPGILTLSNVQSGRFTYNCKLPSLVGPIPVYRGWVSVDAWARGRLFRFISTHLDGDCPRSLGIQAAQAQEILNGPVANAGMPVIFVGDINASPLSLVPSAYQALTAAGMSDAWLTTDGNGFTCCQADDLLNSESILSERIDMILYNTGVEVRSIRTTGDTPGSRTPSGLWASDHAGVVAVFSLIPK